MTFESGGAKTLSERLTVVIPADDPPLVGRSLHLEQLREFADVRLYSDRPGSDAEMFQRLEQADVLLNSRSAVKITGDLLRRLPRLKMIAVCGIGYDAIDMTAAKERGIVVSNVPGRTATVVAEHAFALMLAVSRRMAFMVQELQRGTWSSELGVTLVGRTVGVVGTGNIGSEMIRFCRAFGMNVLAWTFHPSPEKARQLGFQYVELDELLTRSDVVSLHLRLSEESRGLISADRLSRMKREAILVNTARAAIVDTAALVDHLHSGQLFGAGIDVFDHEPIDSSHPLLGVPNVIATPHSADQTPEGLDLLTIGCVENIRAFIDGRPTNVCQ